ncbi:MAG TPA: DUF5362 family protein [Flavisolibacter sp.]|nr:DUF5362 family protein [Flavisolibacter sp.]
MEEDNSLFSLSIDPATKIHLAETARWARFLAIIGFVLIVFMVALGVYSSLTISRYEDMFNGYRGSRSIVDSVGVGVSIVYVIMAVVAFFPLLFMLRFANQMRSALSSNNQALLTSSFQNLKIYFRYLGIITIIFLVLTILSLFMGIAGRAI